MATVYDILNNKEGNGGPYEDVINTLSSCEKHATLLDKSIVEFVNAVANDAPTLQAGIMNHTIAFILCSIFKDPEEIIGIVCNDEKWQKWDTLKWFHEVSNDGENLPPMTYLYRSLYHTKTPITNSKGQEFAIPRRKLPIDFTFDGNGPSGDYFDFAGYLDNAKSLDELSDWQIDNCYVGVFSRKRDEAPEFMGKLISDFPLLQRACLFKEKVDDGTISVKISRESTEGVWVPLKKINLEWSTGNADADTIIDKKCIDMYNLPVLE